MGRRSKGWKFMTAWKRSLVFIGPPLFDYGIIIAIL
jgi:hypothetical protein